MPPSAEKNIIGAHPGRAWPEGWGGGHEPLDTVVADSSRDNAGTHMAAFHPHLSCSRTHCGFAQEESFHLFFTSAISSIWLRRYFILSFQRNFGTYGILKAILTGNISLQVQRIQVFSVEVGPPLVQRTTSERNVWQDSAVEGRLERWIVCAWCWMWTMRPGAETLWCSKGRTAFTFWLCNGDQSSLWDITPHISG